MKKRLEFCEFCQEETLHRYKKKSTKKASLSNEDRKKGTGYNTYPLPIKCFKCGHVIGKPLVKKKQKNKFVKI